MRLRRIGPFVISIACVACAGAEAPPPAVRPASEPAPLPSASSASSASSAEKAATTAPSTSASTQPVASATPKSDAQRKLDEKRKNDELADRLSQQADAMQMEMLSQLARDAGVQGGIIRNEIPPVDLSGAAAGAPSAKPPAKAGSHWA